MDLLLNYLKKWHTLLTNFALEGEFKSAIFSAIKSNNSNQYITQLNNQVKVASYESLPKVEIINSTFEIKSAVYSSSNETIYLNENWLTEANPNNIFEALTEEHCHHIDYKSHSKDTPRDKGFLFAAKLFKKEITKQLLELISLENDHKIVNINGETQFIEQNSMFETKLLRENVNEVC